jgi:hypothetical protein
VLGDVYVDRFHHRASLVDERRPEALNCGVMDRSGVVGRQTGSKHRPAKTMSGQCASSTLNSAVYVCHRNLDQSNSPAPGELWGISDAGPTRRVGRSTVRLSIGLQPRLRKCLGDQTEFQLRGLIAGIAAPRSSARVGPAASLGGSRSRLVGSARHKKARRR